MPLKNTLLPKREAGVAAGLLVHCQSTFGASQRYYELFIMIVDFFYKG